MQTLIPIHRTSEHSPNSMLPRPQPQSMGLAIAVGRGTSNEDKFRLLLSQPWPNLPNSTNRPNRWQIPIYLQDIHGRNR